MSDLAPSPAPLSDADLRETMDLLATAVASISDRVDDQTKMLDRVNKTATEARSAAFAAQKQTNPEQYADFIGGIIENRANESFMRLGQITLDLLKAATHTQEVLNRAERDREAALREVVEREQKLDRFKARLPWVGLGAVAFAVALVVISPTLMAINPTTCAAIGGNWSTFSDDVPFCTVSAW